MHRIDPRLARRFALAVFLFGPAIFAGGVAAGSEPEPVEGAPPATAAVSAPQEEPELAVGEEIVVTAGRTEQHVRDVAVQVTVLGREELERTPAASADELLRLVSGFNLQRPDSSRVLSLSGQAVSFRGLGGTSASRSLVLVDGVPLNEPFAGWINWSRVPLATIERVEIVPGGAAGAWGNQALGGVIHLITRRPAPATAVLDARCGSRDTIDGTLLASHAKGRVAGSAFASHFDTDGYSEVPEELRGPADTTNSSRTSVFDGRLDLAVGPSSAWTLQGNYLVDDREGGNVLSREALEMLSLRASADIARPNGASWALHLFSLLRESSNTRGTISDDRTEVTPRRSQFDIPSSSVGLGLSWTRPFLANDHLLTAGVDGLWTDAEVNEDNNWSEDHFRERFRSGGEQLLAGAYLQDTASVGSRWRLAGGLRVDRWRSSDGVFIGRSLETGVTLYDQRLPDRSELVLSPNLGVRFQASDRLGLRGSVFQSFRAPSPNELFKSTPSNRSYLAANSELEPERIDLGLDVGFDYTPHRSSLLRLSGFWNEIVDAIAEVTVGVAGSQAQVIEPCGQLRPRGVCTQRRNVDLVRNRGVEVDLELRPRERWRVWTSYTYTDSRVVESRTNPALEGSRLQRIPEHQATAQLSYDAPRFLSMTLQARYQGKRYEDDVNDLAIADALLIDLRLSRQLAFGFDVVLDIENLFDAEVEVAKNEDYGELGQPRTVQAGIRYRWQGADRGTP